MAFPKGKKPEAIIKRVIDLSTNRGDWVLDSFAGSGTTGAAAHKMGRRWIMVELGVHCESLILPRLRSVIDGSDAFGITESVGWKGGGGFRFFRLAPPLLEKDPHQMTAPATFGPEAGVGSHVTACGSDENDEHAPTTPSENSV